MESILGIAQNTEGKCLKSKSNRRVYEDWWPQGRESYPSIWVPISTERKHCKYFVTVKKSTTMAWAGVSNV